MLLALIFSLPGFTGPSSVVTERPAAALPSPSPAASQPAAIATPQATPTAAGSPAPSPPNR
jgi:hypothetical protein